MQFDSEVARHVTSVVNKQNDKIKRNMCTHTQQKDENLHKNIWADILDLWPPTQQKKNNTYEDLGISRWHLA